MYIFCLKWMAVGEIGCHGVPVQLVVGVPQKQELGNVMIPSQQMVVLTVLLMAQLIPNLGDAMKIHALVGLSNHW